MDPDIQAKFDALTKLIETANAASTNTQSLLQAVIFGLIVIGLIYFIIRQQTAVTASQTFTNENVRAQMATTQKVALEAELLRTSQAHVIEIEKARVEMDTARTKSMALIAEVQAASAKAMETILGIVTASSKAIDTVAGGQMVIGATTQGTSQAVKQIAAQMLISGVTMGALKKQISEINGDVNTLAENEIAPTQATHEAVREITTRGEGAAPVKTATQTAPAVAAPAAPEGHTLPVSGTVTLTTETAPVTA